MAENLWATQAMFHNCHKQLIHKNFPIGNPYHREQITTKGCPGFNTMDHLWIQHNPIIYIVIITNILHVNGFPKYMLWLKSNILPKAEDHMNNRKDKVYTFNWLHGWISSKTLLFCGLKTGLWEWKGLDHVL